MKTLFAHFESQQLRRVKAVTARGTQAQLAHFLQRVDDVAETARLLYGVWLPVESLTSCWGDDGAVAVVRRIRERVR